MLPVVEMVPEVLPVAEMVPEVLPVAQMVPEVLPVMEMVPEALPAPVVLLHCFLSLLLFLCGLCRGGSLLASVMLFPFPYFHLCGHRRSSSELTK